MKIKSVRKLPAPLRIALVILGVLLGLYYASTATMKTAWFHGWIEQRVIAGLEHMTGARAEIGSIEIRPSIFEITLRHLTLHRRDRTSESPLLAARIVVVRVNPLSLLLRKLWLSRFYARGIEIHWGAYPEDSTHVASIPNAAEAANELMKLAISNFDIVDANLYWNDKQIPLDLTARRVALLLHFNRSRGYWGSCSASPLQLREGGRRFPAVVFGTHLRLTPRGLTLTGGAWHIAGASGSGVANVNWNSSLEASAALQVHGKVRSFAPIVGWKVIQGGQFQSECHVMYRNGRWTARGRLEAEQVALRAPEFAPGRVDLGSDFSASKAGILLSNLKLSTMGGTLAGHGEIYFKTSAPYFSLDLRLFAIDMDQSLRAIPGGRTLAKLLSADSSIAGTARFSWTGNLKNIQSLVNLQFAPPRLLKAGLRPLSGTLRASASVSPGFSLVIDQAQLHTAHSSVAAGGALGATQSSLHLRYSTTHLKEAEPLIDYITTFHTPIPLQLQSSLVFAGAVTGPALNPAIRGHIQAGRFRYQGWAWKTFSANLDAASNHVQVTAGQLGVGPSVFSFAGSMMLDNWKVRPNSAVTLVAEAHGSPLQGLEKAVDARYSISGLASGRLDLGGTFATVTGRGRIQIVDGTADGEPFDFLSAQPLVKNSVWNFQNVLLRKGTGTAKGGVRIDWPGRRFAISLSGASFSLSQFTRLQRGLPASAINRNTASLKGKADFQLHGTGSFSEPTAELTLKVRQIELMGSEAGDIQARIGLHGRKLTVKGSLSASGNERSDFTLDANTQNDWPAAFRSRFTNYRLDPWLRWLGASYSGIPITISGWCRGKGPLRRPRNFSTEAQLQSVTVAAPGFVLKNGQPVDLHYGGGLLDSNSFRMQGPSTDVTIQLFAKLLSQPTLSLGVHGSAQASVLKLLSSSIQAAGSFGLNVSLAGPVAQPALAGAIDVQNLSLRYGEMPLILAGLNGRIALKGNQATIVSLSGVSGESSVQLTGSATISSPLVYDVRARLQNLRFEYPVDFTSLLNGDLHLTGSSQNGEISGDITVQQMFVGDDFNLVNWIGQLGSVFAEMPAAASGSEAPDVRLNLHITSNPEIRLASRTLSFVATIDAALRGTVTHPVAMGDIRIQQGKALIAGNAYQILRGEIAMTSPFQTVPVLDVEAQTRVDRYNLTVDVTGPADRAKLAYRSDPPLPTEDILSLLALGYAPQQQLTTSTGSQPFGTLGASALLSQALSSQVSGRVQQLFGVSRIRIDPNLIGPASAGGARVTVEEQLAHNLSITYSTNTAAAQQRDIRLRWDLSNRISLIGEQDINGVYGFEIRFRRRLR